MGSHGVTSARLSAGKTSQHAREPAAPQPRSPRRHTLRDWPVFWRLVAVIVLALIMGLVFGGLRVASAADSAAEFGRVSQLASLGQRVTGLVQALQDERDETTGVSSGGNPGALQRWYHRTDAAAARVRVLAAGVGGSFPANIQASVGTVLSVINDLGDLRKTAQASQDALAVIANYAAPIGDMITLNDLIAQGISDPSLVNDVRTLNSLSLAKDEAAQQRALFFHTFTDQFFGDGEQQALTTAQSEELSDTASFETTATPAEQKSFSTVVAGPGVDLAEGIEDLILIDGNPLDITQVDGISLNKAPARWYSAMSDKIDKMQTVELQVARNIVARSHVLRRGAEESALFNGIVTAVILFLVLIATLAVARSLVRPLRRLREGALDIATVQLPERVRQLGEDMDPAVSLDVAPIDVLSADEIGQVARAFDQVHAEAVRLAGNEAMLRSSFNAMFVNLSRRSQSLIERLARVIDSLEQDEADPDRLSNLFSMDHLVTRMRRNSENLLLLAGHETTRKWSAPVPLADVVRAATSEIEQYSRVAMNIQPGISLTGPAVSDVVHLLAEIVENATIFSSKDTPVHISGQEISSGGVLIEVRDSGVGIPEARLAEMNLRLDNPPVIDVSVSRHMGLFAVARLAERHGVRVRLRARSPRGLTALVWLPDDVAERGAARSGWPGSRPARSAGTAARTSGSPGTGAHAAPDSPFAGGQAANGWQATAVPTPATMPMPAMPTMPPMPAGAAGAAGAAQAAAALREPAQAADSAVSDWFRSSRSPAPGSGSPSAAPPAGGGWRAGADGWAEGKHAAQIVADPVRGDHTHAGLPMRVPRANLLPGSAGGHRGGNGATSRPPDGRPADSRPADGRPADGRGAQAASAARAPRSPELARSRLSGFQRGTRRAKGQTPHAGEGADR
ncbi:MAG: nitrate- and nitrite sensing domain-containing protein [Streptosporangiaceae bacterium]